MTLRLLEIVCRSRTDPLRTASLDDFSLREATESEADLDALLATCPNFTPYCLVHGERRILFVETPSGLDLSAAPFCYKEQYESAIRILAVPYEHLLRRWARDGFEALVLIYSVGRCGSTMVSRIFRSIDDTYSLSEPDVHTNVNDLRRRGEMSDGDAAAILESVTRALFRPPDPRRRFVLKFRARCMESAGLMHALFPAAKLVFIYRDALDCIDSHVRVFGGGSVTTAELQRSFPFVVPLPPAAVERLGRLGRPLLTFVTGLRAYLELRRRGAPIAALRYEGLVRDPGASVEGLLRHCGMACASVERACGAMAEDAQAGTLLARNPDRSRVLSEEELELIGSFLLRHVGTAPNAILEGTMNP